MTVFINPGSGPVAEATLENATKCMEQFVGDLGNGATFVRGNPRSDGGGRFNFQVRNRDASLSAEVDMPGLPVDRVRFLANSGQNIWNFPRLYVDGSSWIWCYALDIIADDFSPEEKEDV